MQWYNDTNIFLKTSHRIKGKLPAKNEQNRQVHKKTKKLINPKWMYNFIDTKFKIKILKLEYISYR